MESKYVCKLDEATQKKAQEELYEDPKNRQGAIDTFREWIKQQSHLKCPTDDLFLLGFLRAKHFSQLEAREGLERFMKHRDKMAVWTKNLDPASPEISEIIDAAVYCFLPERDDNGRRIVVFRPGRLDPGNKELFTAAIRLFVAISYFNFFCDEMTQVHGTVLVADWTGHTMANEMKIPLDFKKHMASLLTKAFPARVKAIHMCNAGSLLDFLLSIVRKMLTSKLQERLQIHNHGFETLYDQVPKRILPEDYVPDDYDGPNGGSFEKITEHVKAMFNQPHIRDRIKYLSSDQFYINIQEKDKEVVQESFRKLNVD